MKSNYNFSETLVKSSLYIIEAYLIKWRHVTERMLEVSQLRRL